jgi:hypothetical protein
VAYSSIFADADAGPVQASGGVDANLAFGPMSSGSTSGHPLVPSSANGFAWGFWLGVGALVLLVVIRHNLPA